MRISTLERLNAELEEIGREPLANTRNAAAGALKLRESRECAKRKLDFIAYHVVEKSEDFSIESGHFENLNLLAVLGFQTTVEMRAKDGQNVVTSWKVENNLEAIRTSINDMDTAKKRLDIVLDGAVFKLQSITAQCSLGEGTRAPKWAVAYKFPPEGKITRLNAITIQVGKTGRLTPVAELEPVEIDGSTVARASLCNSAEIERLGVNVGYKVVVVKSACIIPKVIKLAPGEAPSACYKMPHVCPACGGPVVRTTETVDMYCDNPHCSGRVRELLIWATSKKALDIDGCGEATVDLLMKAGVRKLSDLFALKDFSCLPPATAASVSAGIQKAKTLPLWRQLVALSIDGVSTTTCKDIASKFSSLKEINEDAAGLVEASKLRSVCGDLQCQAIIDYTLNNTGELVRLIDLGLTFQTPLNQQGPLTGKVFCITGAMPSGIKRDVLSQWIDEKGGSTRGSCSKKVTHLIAGMDVGGTKTEAAKKHGTAIISEDELYALAGSKPEFSTGLPDNFAERDF